jgi:hypothetical protein
VLLKEEEVKPVVPNETTASTEKKDSQEKPVEKAPAKPSMSFTTKRKAIEDPKGAKEDNRSKMLGAKNKTLLSFADDD